jgi:hypothetical protein
LEIDVNEERTFNFIINVGYSLANRNNTVHPIIRGDTSVFTVEDWQINHDNLLTLRLRGHRQGSSSLAIAYMDFNGNIYYTESATVTVNNTTPPTPPGGGGGGGCNTGYGVIGLLLVTFGMRRYMKLTTRH